MKTNGSKPQTETIRSAHCACVALVCPCLSELFVGFKHSTNTQSDTIIDGCTSAHGCSWLCGTIYKSVDMWIDVFMWVLGRLFFLLLEQSK